MATDMFIKIDDVAGESVDNKHANEIEVLSWSWNASQTGSSHTAKGSGAGKANVGDLNFLMAVDKAVPVLLGMLLTGKPFQQALLTVRKAGGEALEYLTITMKNGLIASISFTGSPGTDALHASISLNFSHLEVKYTPQAADGTGGATVDTTWDIAKQTAA